MIGHLLVSDCASGLYRCLCLDDLDITWEVGNFTRDSWFIRMEYPAQKKTAVS